MERDTFVLTDEHVRLLRQARVRWEEREWGAPAISTTSPYGGTDLVETIATLLGWERPAADEPPESHQAERERAVSLHHAMETVLAIVCQHAGGALRPGTYRQEGGLWRRVGEEAPPGIEAQGSQRMQRALELIVGQVTHLVREARQRGERGRAAELIEQQARWGLGGGAMPPGGMDNGKQRSASRPKALAIRQAMQRICTEMERLQTAVTQAAQEVNTSCDPLA